MIHIFQGYFTNLVQHLCYKSSTSLLMNHLYFDIFPRLSTKVLINAKRGAEVGPGPEEEKTNVLNTHQIIIFSFIANLG